MWDTCTFVPFGEANKASSEAAHVLQASKQWMSTSVLYVLNCMCVCDVFITTQMVGTTYLLWDWINIFFLVFHWCYLSTEYRCSIHKDTKVYPVKTLLNVDSHVWPFLLWLDSAFRFVIVLWEDFFVFCVWFFFFELLFICQVSALSEIKPMFHQICFLGQLLVTALGPWDWNNFPPFVPLTHLFWGVCVLNVTRSYIMTVKSLDFARWSMWLSNSCQLLYVLFFYKNNCEHVPRLLADVRTFFF